MEKKAVTIAVALAVIVAMAVAFWYFWKIKGPAKEPYVPFTGEEKRGVLQDLSVPAGSALPDTEKQKILEGLSAPPAQAPGSVGQPQAATQTNDAEKLKLLESLKAQ